MQWIEISIVCERVATDEVSTLFGDYADNGIIEEDVLDHPERQKLTIYVDPNQDIDSITTRIQNILNDAHIKVFQIDTSILDESTWYNSWQQYIEPTEILPNIVIKPAWQDYENSEGKNIIEIDSDLSFGTGSHETTRNCAILLHDYIESLHGSLDSKLCLDIGTGTGILLLISAKLGINQLVGIDIDEASAIQARKNCEHNLVDAKIIHGDLAKDFNDTAHIVLANLTVDPLKQLLPVIGQKLDDEGLLIISGIIDDRYEEIMPYINDNWRIEREVVDGPWHTFSLRKKR